MTTTQNEVDEILSAELPYPEDVWGKVPKEDWAKIDKFATEELGYRIDRISGDLMRRGWKVRQRQLDENAPTQAITNPIHKATLEARIDELREFIPQSDIDGEKCLWERIDDLTAQLAELEKL